MMSRGAFWDKRIPTILGLIIIAFGIGFTTYLVQIGVIPNIGAAAGDVPKNIRVTNVTDSSFTVTYATDTKVIGTVNVQGNTQQLFFDGRDNTNIPQPHLLHTIQVKNLKPKTTYAYSILSGKSTYLNKDSPFSITTGPSLEGVPNESTPLTGKIVTTTGDIPTEALVYITMDNAQTISTILSDAGFYAIPLQLRAKDLNSFTTLTNETKIQMLIIGAQGETSEVVLYASQKNPVPVITLSENYDFTANEAPIASSSALPIGFPLFGLDTTIVASESPKIDVPQNNETFTDTQPLLHGKVLPNENVSITIHSDAKISTTVKADQYGNWSFRPPNGLSVGTHTISITSKDQNGILQTIVKTFVILASGNQVAEAATPSATLTQPTPTPTNIPTITSTPPSPTPIQSGSPNPTIQISPSASASPTVSPSLVPTSSFIKPTPTKIVPPSGNQFAVLGSVVGVATTLFGIVIILFARFVI